MNVNPLVNSLVGSLLSSKRFDVIGKIGSDNQVKPSTARIVTKVEQEKRSQFVELVVTNVRWKELTPLVAREVSDVNGIQFQASIINNQWVYYIRDIDTKQLKIFDAYRLCQAVDIEPTRSDYYLLRNTWA